MLSIISNNSPLTMSSREIAELTGKQHKHVKRDIDVMCSELNRPNLDRSNFEHNGNTYTEYNLDKELTLCLVSGYNVKLRMSIIKRWKDLEESQGQLPKTFAQALQLAADQAAQLELQAPKVAFVEKLVERDNLLTATQVAQKHCKSAIWLNKILMQHDVYNKNVKRAKAFRQWFINKKYGEMKQNDVGRDQALFTNSGEIWINELLIAHGY